MAKLQAAVPVQHLEAIGRITVNFALLESTVGFFAWMLLGTDQRLGQAVTAEASFRNQVALVSSLFRIRSADKSLVEGLDVVLKSALAAEERRNAITHSVWAAGAGGRTITRIKTTAKVAKGLKHQSEQMTADDLSTIAEQIAEAAGNVQEYMFWSLSALKAAAPASELSDIEPAS